MKICPNCHTPVDDSAAFCTKCGSAVSAPPQQSTQPQVPSPVAFPEDVPPQAYAAPVNPYDHTAEYDPKDISDNKVIAMLVYLLGIVGVFIALLACGSSAYVSFHVRQSLKFTVVEILSLFVMIILAITIIVPIAGVIFYVVLFVCKIICFFQICQGKAVEPVIIRSFGFLK